MYSVVGCSLPVTINSNIFWHLIIIFLILFSWTVNWHRLLRMWLLTQHYQEQINMNAQSMLLLSWKLDNNNKIIVVIVIIIIIIIIIII